jgi:diguanylate cyclase (GGDEF)-like protein
LKINISRKDANIKTFLLLFLIISIMYLLITVFTVRNRIEEHFVQLEQSSVNIAKSYSKSLVKSKKSEDIINDLMNDQLRIAGNSLSLYEGEMNDEVIQDIASIIEVDVFYVYNDGKIIYSNTGDYIGWETKVGHPVFEFMVSDKESLIDDIRKDSESDIYYKYGYFRFKDFVIQIGIYAETVQSLLQSFQIEKLLNEIREEAFIEHVCFVDNDYNFIASTMKEQVGTRITDDEVIKAISNNQVYTHLNNYEDAELFQAYVPVYVGDTKIGSLIVSQSTAESKAVMKEIIWNGIWILLSIITTVGFTVGISYYKSKKNLETTYFDSLTGLPNKEYMEEFLKNKLSEQSSNKHAIFLFHYNNFKTINITFGYDYGDRILEEVSEKLLSLINQNVHIFRFSADRFILYIERYTDQFDLIQMIQKIDTIMQKPFINTNHGAYMGVEVGIVEEANRYQNVDKLIKDVTIALSHIGINTGLNYMFFNDRMEDTIRRESMIVKELQEVLKKEDSDTIYLEYQPQLDLKTDKIVAFEALSRMKSKQLGFVSPLEFIYAAEKNHLIVPLGNLVLKKACSFIKRMNEQHDEKVRISVNISGVQLLQVDFIDALQMIINESGIQSELLELEITESVLLDNYELVNLKLKEIQNMGIKIALDDFGTGYSSFARLYEMNTNIVKIDRYFISRISINNTKELITSDIISMAHKLGLTVVAEGVEYDEQKQYLKKHHCDIMQGYLFSKPLKENLCCELLKKHQSKI